MSVSVTGEVMIHLPTNVMDLVTVCDVWLSLYTLCCLLALLQAPFFILFMPYFFLTCIIHVNYNTMRYS